MDEIEALGLIFANTRRNKRSVSLLDVAEALRYEVELKGLNEASKTVGLSREMIREFTNILEFPETLKEMIRRREIDSIDMARRINSLRQSGVNDSDLVKFLKEHRDLKTEDFRDLETLVKRTRLSVDKAYKIISLSKRKREHVFVLSLDEITYKKIKSISRKEGIDESLLVKRLINQVINSTED
jgi:hypothetical protein